MRRWAMAALLAGMFVAFASPFGEDIVNDEVDGIPFFCSVNEDMDFSEVGTNAKVVVTAYRHSEKVFVAIPFDRLDTAYGFAWLYATVYNGAKDFGGGRGASLEDLLFKEFAPVTSERMEFRGFPIVVANVCRKDFSSGR